MAITTRILDNGNGGAHKGKAPFVVTTVQGSKGTLLAGLDSISFAARESGKGLPMLRFWTESGWTNGWMVYDTATLLHGDEWHKQGEGIGVGCNHEQGYVQGPELLRALADLGLQDKPG